jgi:hypothetical protein
MIWDTSTWSRKNPATPRQPVPHEVDPVRSPSARFFYDLRLPIQRLSVSGKTALRAAAILIEPLSRIFAGIAQTQCNEFAFAVTKSRELHPWIT